MNTSTPHLPQIEKQNAEAYYIRHEKYSWAQIVITDKGDFMINSDYGAWATAWRHFGDNFKEFIVNLNAEYVASNFESTANMSLRPARRYRVRKEQLEAIAAYLAVLQEQLRKELSTEAQQ